MDTTTELTLVDHVRDLIVNDDRILAAAHEHALNQTHGALETQWRHEEYDESRIPTRETTEAWLTDEAHEAHVFYQLYWTEHALFVNGIVNEAIQGMSYRGLTS